MGTNQNNTQRRTRLVSTSASRRVEGWQLQTGTGVPTPNSSMFYLLKGPRKRGCGFHVAVGLYLEACFSRVAEGYCGGRYAAGLSTEPPLVLM